MEPIKNLCIVIPTKNEEKTIEEIIKRGKQYTEKIILVDGHSTDKTRDIAESLKVKVIMDSGRGKGSGIRASIEHVADEDIIVFIDADGSHDHKDIPKLIKPIQEGKADNVTGSRLLGGSDRKSTRLNSS